MFEGTIAQPIPDGVSELQGVGDMWQSYDVWLRFRATDAAIAAIIHDGFERVSYGRVADRFRLPRGYDRFRPDWAPPTEQVECYEATRSCPWSTAGGRQYLLIDRTTGTVYARADGD
jgi:hypothetical protein